MVPHSQLDITNSNLIKIFSNGNVNMLDIVFKFKIPQKWHKGEQHGQKRKKMEKIIIQT
jgi:hypothetical protein